MLKKLTLIAFAAAASVSFAKAQDTLSISGSVDTYYKYDFAKVANIPTSFASDQNSVSLGMLDLALKKTTGKASFVGEVGFGPRGQYQSVLNGDGAAANAANSFNIQNLYVSYAFNDMFSLTAGYMGTFVGYEVISPVGNFNYSTSYLFTSGPFQNAGIKANLKVSDKVGLMVGLFDDWNVYSDFNGVSHIGAQLSLTPVEGWNAYLNVLSGRTAVAGAGGDGTILDLTTTYQITEAFKAGLNVADYSIANDLGGYSGGALYLQNAFTPGVALGVRAEYFKIKDIGAISNPDIKAITLTGNLKSGSFTFIPEVRFDNSSKNVFVKEDLSPSKNAAQFSLAAVFAF